MREDYSIGEIAVVWARKPNYGSFCCVANRLYAKWPISFPGPSNFLRRMLNENEGSAKVQFLGNPVWLSEMQYSTISPIFADY